MLSRGCSIHSFLNYVSRRLLLQANESARLTLFGRLSFVQASDKIKYIKHKNEKERERINNRQQHKYP